MKRILIFLLSCPIAFVITFAQMEAGHERECERVIMMKKEIIGEKGPGMMRMRMADDLKLTDEQQKKIDALEYETALEIAKLRAELEINRINFEFEMKKENPDEVKIKGLLKKIGELETGIKVADVMKMIKINKTLTPEQRRMMQMHKCCKEME